MISDSILIAVIAGIPGVIGSLLVYRQSGKAAERAAEAAKESAKAQVAEVERGAYERARKLYEDGIAQLERQLDRVRAQMAEEQDVSAKLRARVFELENTVAALRRQLVNAGLELAPGRFTPDPDGLL